jgi:hypothetical protein
MFVHRCTRWGTSCSIWKKTRKFDGESGRSKIWRSCCEGNAGNRIGGRCYWFRIALLCLSSPVIHNLQLTGTIQDHISPITPISDPFSNMANLVNILIRAAAYTGHIYFGEKLWSYLLDGKLAVILARPEKSVRFPGTYRKGQC